MSYSSLKYFEIFLAVETTTTTETFTDEIVRLVDERYVTRVEMAPHYTEPRDVQQGQPVR